MVVGVNNKKGEAMVKKKLQILLLTFFVVSTSCLDMQAFRWAPIGDGIDALGYAITGTNYQYGDAVTQAIQPYPGAYNYNRGFTASELDATLELDGRLTNPASAILDQYSVPAIDNGTGVGGYPTFDGTAFAQCSLKIDGDILISAIDFDMEVIMSSTVKIEPYYALGEGVSLIAAGLPGAGQPVGTANVGVDTNGITYGNQFSQLFFEVPSGGLINFYVDYDLTFDGRAHSSINTPASYTGVHQDMIITFKGPGQTIFHLADGVCISFDGQMDKRTPVVPLPDGCDRMPDFTQSVGPVTFLNEGCGTKVYIIMDQEKEEVARGQHKVLFKRTPGAPTSGQYDAPEAVNCTVFVGPNSWITYLSIDPYGDPFVLDDGTIIDDQHAAVGFDPSNDDFVDSESGEVFPATGRLVLLIKGAYDFGTDPQTADYLFLTARYPFNDGAVIVSGHLLQEFGEQGERLYDGAGNPTLIADPANIIPAHIRFGIDFSRPAGAQATLAIPDDGAYFSFIGTLAEGDTTTPFSPTFDSRRGLLLFNDCANVSKMASDPYWDLYNHQYDGAAFTLSPVTQGARWAYASPYNAYAGGSLNPAHPGTQANTILMPRRGFVLGVNGRMDVYQNRFCDFVAAFNNTLDPCAVIDFFSIATGSQNYFIKARNASALVTDGQDPRLYPFTVDDADAILGHPFSVLSPTLPDFRPANALFDAGNPFINDAEDVRHAQVHLRGNGALYLRSTASSFDGYDFNYWGDYYDAITALQATLTPGDPSLLLEPLRPYKDEFISYLRRLTVGTLDADPDFGFGFPELSTYDGFLLTANSQSIQLGEGNHVLDVEGPCDVISRPTVVDNGTVYYSIRTQLPFDSYLGTFAEPYSGADVATGQRNYSTDQRETACGNVQMISTWIDHTGQEIAPDLTSGLTNPLLRPLLADGTSYARYNSPGIFCNNFLSFFDSHLIHSDATKLVNGTPQSDPAIVGGERYYVSFTAIPELVESRVPWILYTDPTGLDLGGSVIVGDNAAQFGIDLDTDRYRTPEVRLFNSRVDLQESLCSTGVRFVTMDRRAPITSDPFGVTLPTFLPAENNNSSIVFYDHGDPLDTLLTGYGRTFLCGSMLSNMTNIIYDDDTFQLCTAGALSQSNDVLENCYVNVFRKRSPVAEVSDLYDAENQADVNLWLQNADDSADADICDPVLRGHWHPDVTVGTEKLQKAHHLFLLGITDNGVNNLRVGWPIVNTNPKESPEFPGQIIGPVGDLVNFPYPDELQASTEAGVFSIDALKVKPATLTVDGKVICFGAFNFDGLSSKVPATASGNDSGVIFIDHGGRLTITPQDVTLNGLGATSVADSRPGLKNIDPSELVIDTIVAQKLWGDYQKHAAGSYESNERKTWLSGIIDLPHDQSTFTNDYAVQPYGLSQIMYDQNVNPDFSRQGFVRLPYRTNLTEPHAAAHAAVGHRQPYRDRTGAEEVLISWFYRDYRGTSDSNPEIPVKVVNDFFRSTETVTGPVTPPTDILYVGPNDDIVQMRVAGATMSDPFHLLVSGHDILPTIGRVRELTTEKTNRDLPTNHLIGEGAHAAIFVDLGGRVGLGSRDWNEHSVNAWSVLGKDYVSIYPMGDGIIDVNSNLIIADRLPIVATTAFSVFAEGETEHTLSFYAEREREIRIPSDGELDLSSFGSGLEDGSGKKHIIAFEGNVSLILEDGAKIRFPSNLNPQDIDGNDQGTILYFTDNSKLIFEGRADDRTGQYDDVTTDEDGNLLKNTSPAASIDDERVKILGKGQIWLNKNATMSICDEALVGIQTDDLSPVTDIIISIQRQGSLEIGDSFISGGALEVGNPYNRNEGADPFGESTTSQPNHSINFQLVLNGRSANVEIERLGFLGLGAGVLRKNGTPNGRATAAASAFGPNPVTVAGIATPSGVFPIFNPDTEQAWVVQPLFNVDGVVINVTQGQFVHDNIADGANDLASLLAVGPVVGFSLLINGQGEAVFRGGGNIMHVPATGQVANQVYAVNVWDFLGQVSTGESYSVMSSAPIMFNTTQTAGNPSPFLDGGTSRAFVNDSLSFFNYISLDLFTDQTAAARMAVYARDDQNDKDSFVVFTTDGDDVPKYGLVTGSQIIRKPNPSLTGDGDIAEAARSGAVIAYADNGAGQPRSYGTSVN